MDSFHQEVKALSVREEGEEEEVLGEVVVEEEVNFLTLA